MKQFVWKAGFAIGINEIDLQHQTLLKHLNECILFASSHDNIIDPRAMINNLKAYSRLHFTAEEALLRKINYPDFDMHLRQHSLFDEHVSQLENAVTTGEKHAIPSLVSFLTDWFLQHVLVEDKRYAEYIQARGFGSDISIW